MQEASRPSADNALIGRAGPKGRAFLAVAAALLTLVIALSIGYAATPGGWPATCLEFNDIVEAHLDHPGNVGIYQRTFGDQAEAACQNDHRAQVQASFAWAMPMPAAATAPTPAPGSTPAPSPAVSGLPTVPRDLRVERSGGGYVIRAHPPADGGGLSLLGYRWSITGATTRSGVVASSGGGLTLRLDPLQPGDQEVTLIAYNANGDSPSAVTRFSTPVCRIEVDLIQDEQGSFLVRGTNRGNQVISGWRARYVIHGSGRGPWPAWGARVAVGQTETIVLWYRSPSNLGPAPDIELLDGGYAWCSDD